MTANVLYNRLRELIADSSHEEILAEIKHLTEVVEQQNKDIIALRSWRSKIFDMILSGLIGALISAAVVAALG